MLRKKLLLIALLIVGCEEYFLIETEGCTTTTACNYDATATTDDGSCLENDCAGECGGSAVVDECGVCGGDGAYLPAADHLLIIRVVTQPDEAESFSIYNPTDSPVDLAHYYICDDEEYYKMQTEGVFSPSSSIGGFTVQFPDISISPGDTFHIVLNEDYKEFYGEDFVADLVMFGSSDSSLTGSVGFSSNKIDEIDELIILFKWDGESNYLIEDVDYFVWSCLDGVINVIDKTGIVGIDSYADDTALDKQLYFETVAGQYYAYSRIGTDEIDEIKNDGNGITCHDETSENFRESWESIPLFNLGCTNQDAPNYDPYAEVDDGSCLASFEDILNGEYEECFSSCNLIPSTCLDILIQGIVINYFDLTNEHGIFIIENSAGIQLPLGVFLSEVDIEDSLFPFIVDHPLKTVLIQAKTYVKSHNDQTWLYSCGTDSIILVDIYGCSDPSACNFNAEATINDNSCIYESDCAGECGGGAAIDSCGTCDNDATNDCVQDCAGAWGGSAVEDECGVCGGSGKQTTYTEVCDDEYVCQDVQVSSQVDNYGYWCTGGVCNYKECADSGCTSCAGCPNTCAHYGGTCNYMNVPETVYEWVTQCDWVTDCDTETVTSCP